MPSTTPNDQTPATPALLSFQFHDDTIVTFEIDGQRYVVMRRIVENMGLAWQSQSAKLNEQVSKFNCHDIVSVGADGKHRSMLCMPIEKLPLWLACINPNKVRNPAVRAKIELYQAESAMALHDYWTKGGAFRSPPPETFDHQPTEAMKQLDAVRVVTEARYAFGQNAARQLWFVLGLPVVPAMGAGQSAFDIYAHQSDQFVRARAQADEAHVARKTGAAPQGRPWPKRRDTH